MGAILGRSNPDQMWIPDGNASLPGLAFQSEPSLGFYRSSAGVLAFVGTIAVHFPDGTQALPGIVFTNDPDTGFYRIGPNNLGLTLGGVLSFQFTAAATYAPAIFVIGNTRLNEDATSILSLKNDVSAQEFRVYGTTTGPKYVALKHDGTNAYLALGVLGDLNSSKITVKGLTAMANATAVTIATVTIPNAIHGGSVRVTATGTLGDGDSTQTVIANIAISRIAGANAKAVASASAAAAATAGATANATTTVSVTAVAGAAGASNTFDIQVAVARSAGASTNHTVTAEIVLLNELATGLTIV